jgi:DNA-binding NarL/FixJ family response regulator
MISVYLLDDHPLVLEGVRHALDTESDMEVVGEESDPARACEALPALRPDVLVVDLQMESIPGLEVVRYVARDIPDTRVVVLSMHDELPYVWEAMRVGARAYVLKCAGRDELLQAVRTVVAGARFLSPPLSDGRVEAYGQMARCTASIDPLDILTRREREVVRHAATGLTNAEIATTMRIGVRTVETHRASALHKLNLQSQTDLVRFAISKGIVPLP